MKKLLSLLTALSLSLALTLPAPAAEFTLDNFQPRKIYAGDFTDVPETQWYAEPVKACFEYDLMNGKGAGTFDPMGHLTVAEAIKMSVSINQIYRTGTATLTNGKPWYKPYVDYVLEQGILADDFDDYTRPITRIEMAHLFCGSLLPEALPVKNSISLIPDVPLNSAYGPDVYTLYQAGVLTGKDVLGSFLPDQPIIRAEAAAILARMAIPDLRVSFSLDKTPDPTPHPSGLWDGAVTLVDANGIQIIADGYENDTVRLTLANSNSYGTELYLNDLVVDGCAIQNHFLQSLAPGQTLRTELVLDPRELDLAQIPGISRLEFGFTILSLADYSTWNTPRLQLRTCYEGPVGTPLGYGSSLADQYNIKLTFEGFAESSLDLGPGPVLCVTNNTGMMLDVEPGALFFNDQETFAYEHYVVPAGTRKVFALQPLIEYLPAGITTSAHISSLSLTINIYDHDSHEALVETGPITLEF